jgi:WD40 repeat protein
VAAADYLSPPSIPDHELIECIGHGSYGEVWRARNVVGTERAVKVARRDRFDSERPYEREFAGIQKFEPISRAHQGVVDILHLGRVADGSHFYYVMELADDLGSGVDVPGPGSSASDGQGLRGPEGGRTEPGAYVPKTLRAVLKAHGRLPLDEVIELGVAMCEALGHLHRHGLVHRDVKPSNLVYVGNRPKLADIGLVTGIDEARSFVGTVGYIPLEGHGTPGADLYALGRMLYEAATGMNRHDFPELPDDFRDTKEGGAFAELNEILLRAGATLPAHRYASAEQMRAELLLLQSGASVRGLRHNERLLKRFKAWALVGTALLVVLAAAAFLQRQRASDRAAQIRALTMKEEQRRQTAYAADMAIAFQSWEAGRAGLTRRLLEGQSPPPGRDDLRGWEWRYLWAQSRSRERQQFRTDNAYGFWSCAISPDGHKMAAGVVDGYVELWDLSIGKSLGRLNAEAGVNPVDGIAFSPDGRTLLHSLRTSGEVIAWNLGSRKPAIRFGSGRSGLRQALSLDGLLVATADGPPYSAVGPGEVRLWDAATGREVARSALQSTYFTRAEFSPDGKHLATVGGRGYAKVWSVSDLREVAVLPHENRHNVFGLSFSPAGDRLVTGSLDGLIRIWDWRTPRILALLFGHSFGVETARWSPDGTLLATGGRDQIVRLWNTTHFTELATFKGHAARINALAFSPDGRLLFSASEDKTLRSWDLTGIARDLPPRTWSASTFDPELAFSHTSQWLALRGLSNVVELRSLPDFPIVAQMPGDRPIFAPDDRWLVTRGTNQLLKFNLPEGRLLGTFDSKEPLAGTPAVSPDGLRLAAATASGQVLLWQTSTSGPALRLGSSSNRLEGLFFTPGNRELAALHAVDGMLEWFDTDTGQSTRRLATGEGSVTSVALSPDGAYVLIGETAARLRLVELETGQVELLEGDTGSVLSVAWSPDGQTFAAGSFEGFVKLWNTRTRRELAALRGHTSMVTALEFSRDRRHLVSGSVDGTWRVWSAPPLTDTDTDSGVDVRSRAGHVLAR